MAVLIDFDASLELPGHGGDDLYFNTCFVRIWILEGIKVQKIKQQGFTVIEIILVVAVFAVIGIIGYQAWQNMQKAKSQGSGAATTQKTLVVKAGCAANETEFAATGVFCSTQLGIKFTVPDSFKGKLSKGSNYAVYEGTLDQGEKGSSAGKSEVVFRAQTVGNGDLELTIAKEPLRSGYTDVIQALENTYFDKTTGALNAVNAARYNYDSATDKLIQTSKASLGEAVPSFTVGETRIYRASTADAGVQEITYFAVIKGAIVKIGLKQKSYIGDPAKAPAITVDPATVFNSLEDGVKKLQVL